MQTYGNVSSVSRQLPKYCFFFSLKIGISGCVYTSTAIDEGLKQWEGRLVKEKGGFVLRVPRNSKPWDFPRLAGIQGNSTCNKALIFELQLFHLLNIFL